MAGNISNNPFGSQKPQSADDLVSLIDRNFLEAWLAYIREAVIQAGENANGQSISFVCQLAVMACLEQMGRMPEDHEQALDIGLNLVKNLWVITPVGAKHSLKPDAWASLGYASYRTPSAAWQNIHVPAARRAFQKAIEARYQKYPALSAKDREELAEKSPVFEFLKSSDRTGQFDSYITFEVLERFHQVQAKNYLGHMPERDTTLEEYAQIFGSGSQSSFLQISRHMDLAFPLMMAHRTRYKNPKSSSHQQMFQAAKQDADFSGVWQSAVNRIKADSKNPQEFEEYFLKQTFLCSYEAVHQITNSQEYIELASQRGPGFRADANFQFRIVPDLPAAGQVASGLIMAVEEYYQTAFPHLGPEDIGNLLYYNPIFIYMSLLRLEGTHALEGLTSLDQKDNWDE